MAKTMNLGKVAMTTAGAYDSSKSYERLTCVLYNHVSWVSRKEVPAGIIPGTNEVYWQKVSERGEQGIQGPVGPQGNSAFDGNGVEIVNNLTQGGEAAVLSAEQGKILDTKLTELESENGTYCYFQAGWNPSINIIKANEEVSVSVDLSSLSVGRQMRIVKKGGNVLYAIEQGELYNLSNAEKLVFDRNTHIITKVSYNAEGNFIMLLAVNGESISGILAPYYLRKIQKIDYLTKYHCFGESYVNNINKDYILVEGVSLKKGHTYRFYLSSTDTITMSADTNLKIRTKTDEKTIVGTTEFNGKVFEAGKEEKAEILWNFDDVDDYCVAIRFSASPYPSAYLKLRIEDVTIDEVYSRTTVGGEYLQWEQGSLQGEDGAPYDSSTRIRTNFIKVSKGDSIIGLGELTYYVYFYSENKTFDNSIGWVSGVTTVKNDGYIRIIRRHEDNSVISDTDVENLAKGITLESSYNTIRVLIDKLNTTKENLYCLIQSGGRPYFTFSNNNGEGSINISFDNNMRGKHIRIYFIGVGEVADYVLKGDENFTVKNGQSLVFDKDNGVLKVVPVSEVGNYYLLFTSAASGFAYSGLLYPYYAASADMYVLDVQKNSLAKKGSVAYKTTGAYGNGSCDLKFVHFSDIHGLSEKVQRMIEVSNSFGDDLDFILNTGDVVASIQSDGLDWYNAVLNTSNKDVLTCIGNHDAWSADDTVNQDRTVAYGLITKPLVAEVEGIMQPSNASSQGLNYWYKDYINIRLIAIDCIYWDSAQATWFSSVLAEAKGLGLEVICVSHAPFDLQYMDILESKWSSLCNYFQDATITPIQAAELVSNFIDDGGKFISWFVGHTHRDYVIKLKDDYNNQPVMVVGSGRNDKVADIVKSDNKADYSYDLFNYVGIDCTNKVIKIVRIGADTDYFMRRRISLCFKYDEGRIIAD